jgi:hypothetical protein
MYINVDLKDAPESYEGSIAPQIMFDTIAETSVTSCWLAPIATDPCAILLKRTICSL